ncbi:MAG: hypothetical protein JJE25_12725 [Bacteroidia bacterium]|nr:hypothetical protein [Bacteroidia bacterium]
MKKIYTRLFVCVCTMLMISATSNAQYYTGVGLRLGKFASGVSFKYFFDANNAKGIEIIAAKTKTAKGGYLLTGLYECQTPIKIPILQIPLDLVFGGGVHGGYFAEGYYRLRDGEMMAYGPKVFTAGIDAILGLEYKIPIAPLTIGVDCQPFYDLLNPGPEFIDFSVAIRYVFE